MHCAAPKRSRKGLHMSDDIVAAHLAAALIQAGSQKLDAKTAATIYFNCLEAVRAERQNGMSPPKGALAGIDGPDGNKAQPATPLGLGHDCCRPISSMASPAVATRSSFSSRARWSASQRGSSPSKVF
jgi:hypothetical protein